MAAVAAVVVVLVLAGGVAADDGNRTVSFCESGCGAGDGGPQCALGEPLAALDTRVCYNDNGFYIYPFQSFLVTYSNSDHSQWAIAMYNDTWCNKTNGVWATPLCAEDVCCITSMELYNKDVLFWFVESGITATTQSPSTGGSHAGPIIGVVIAGTVMIVIVAVVVYKFVYLRRRRDYRPMDR